MISVITWIVSSIVYLAVGVYGALQLSEYIFRRRTTTITPTAIKTTDEELVVKEGGGPPPWWPYLLFILGGTTGSFVFGYKEGNNVLGRPDVEVIGQSVPIDPLFIGGLFAGGGLVVTVGIVVVVQWLKKRSK